MDYKEFLEFLCLIALPRVQEFEKLAQSTPAPEAGHSCVDVYFSNLKHCILSILSNKSFSFFGLKKSEYLEDEGDEKLIGSLQFTQLKSKDNLGSVLRRCLPSPLGSEGAQVPFHCLLQALPDSLKGIVTFQSGPDSAFGSAYAAFRAFELHKIQTVIHELTSNADFNSVVPNFKL